MKIKDFTSYIHRNAFSLLFCLFFIASFHFLNDSWCEAITRYWIRPIFNDFSQSLLCIRLFTLISIIIYLIVRKETEYIRLKRIVILLIAILVYIICFRSNNKYWSFVPISSNINVIYYTDIIILLGLFEVFLYSFYVYKRKHKNNKLNSTRILEMEETEKTHDEFQRKEMVNSVCHTLSNCFYENNSFAIAIYGSWGSGKTTTLYMMKNKLKELQIKSFLFFEPWRYDSIENMQKAFFDLLKSELKLYESDLSLDISRYAKHVIDQENTVQELVYKSLSTIVSIKGKKELYEELKNRLKNLKHKTVIFIDDIDRLNALEIRAVLRLIRNTANFPYLLFIVALDKNYVINTLTKTGMLNAEQYLEKIFNVSIPLPLIDYTILYNQLIDKLFITVEKIWQDTVNKTDICNSIQGPEIPDERISNDNLSIQSFSLIPYKIKTMRDVIRFSNSFKLLCYVYKDQHVNSEINVTDLIQLEILKMYYPRFYDLLKYNPEEMLYIDEQYDLKLKTDKEIMKSKVVNTIENFEEIINNDLLFKSTLHALFHHPAEDKRMNLLSNYYSYFRFRLDTTMVTDNDIVTMCQEIAANDNLNLNKVLHDKNKIQLKFKLLLMLQEITSDHNLSNGSPVLNLINMHTMLAKLSKLDVDFNHIVADIILKQIIQIDFVKYSSLQLNSFLSLFYDAFDSMKIYDDNPALSLFSELFQIEKTRGRNDDNLNKRIHIIQFIRKAKQDIALNFSAAFSKLIREWDNYNILLFEPEDLIDFQVDYLRNHKNKIDDFSFELFALIKTSTSNSHILIDYVENARDIMLSYINREPSKYFYYFIEKVIKAFYYQGNKNMNLVACNVFGSVEEIIMFTKNHLSIKYALTVYNFCLIYKHNNSFYPRLLKEEIDESIQHNFKRERADLEDYIKIKKLPDKFKIRFKEYYLDILDRNELQISLKYELIDELKSLRQTSIIE